MRERSCKVGNWSRCGAERSLHGFALRSAFHSNGSGWGDVGIGGTMVVSRVGRGRMRPVLFNKSSIVEQRSSVVYSDIFHRFEFGGHAECQILLNDLADHGR